MKISHSEGRMRPQKFMVTIYSPSGWGNWKDNLQKWIFFHLADLGYTDTKVEVEEIYE